MNDFRMFAVRARDRNFFFVTTGVADEFIRVGVKSKREEAVWTEGLPATRFTDGERSGAATVVID